MADSNDSTVVDPRRSALGKVSPIPRAARLPPPPPKRPVVLDDDVDAGELPAGSPSGGESSAGPAAAGEQTPPPQGTAGEAPAAAPAVEPRPGSGAGPAPAPTAETNPVAGVPGARPAAPTAEFTAAPPSATLAAPATAPPAAPTGPAAAPAWPPAEPPAVPAGTAAAPAPAPAGPAAQAGTGPQTTPERTPGARDAQRSGTSSGERDDDGGPNAESYGTRKGNLTYVSTSIPRPLSDRLDTAAEGTTLGVVLMRAVRAHHRAVRAALEPEPVDPDDPFPPPQVRVFYRPPGGSIRRDIGVRPEEAAAIWRVAHDIGITPSAFMRMVLQQEFGDGPDRAEPGPPQQ